ncbi:hypothetical protein CRUP_022060 [Coryphaenoides rupestris]|nr:hypothetical protein CRUP_022060 [Coryphaenoides rupestris]
MPSRDYYFNDGNYQKVREAYVHFMVSIAKIAREDRNLTQDDERVWEEIGQVLDLETDIANATSPVEERQDVTVLYNRMTLAEVQDAFSFNGFNWTRFLQGVLSSVNIKIQPEEDVVIYSPPYLEKMNEVLTKHSVSLSRRFKEARAQYRKALFGTTVDEVRWRDCVRYVQRSMENAVGALYVRENFAGESKRMVSDLISKIQEAYVETLEELSWMDVPSKQKAREKVATGASPPPPPPPTPQHHHCTAPSVKEAAMAIKEHIGYPDHILDQNNGKLDEEYAHLNFSEDNYFENILVNLQCEAHKILKKLRQPVSDLISKIQEAYVETLEELSWMDVPSKQKAREKAMAIKEHIGYPDHILDQNNGKLDEEYAHLNFSEDNYFENILVNLQLFPAGILQPPFFSKHQPQALNFGGIGMVIGHEITHGFDDNGRNFDKDGNMLNWWSNYSAEHFKEQSQCMVQQYGNFNWKLAGGQNISGIITLGENIADNGGVRQAFKAYLKWVAKEGEEPHLPGLDMDHKQLFFLNFAQYASQSIKTDFHSPWSTGGTPRCCWVLGSLQNFEAFSEAFQCAKGSRMNPEMKCRVW